MKASHTAQQRWIVRETPISVNLAPVGKQAFDIIEEVRTLRMPRQLRLLPGRAHFELRAQALDLAVEFVKLLLGLHICAGHRFQVRDLPFNAFNVFSGSGSCVHEWGIAEGKRRSVNDLNAATAAEFFRA